ncbi:arylsulfatase [Pelagicoccus mobilis]|uniref:Arylsulfatase n=1 Tax=Pelagicoccus mobilis TaxID=415221 RepID=A0A934RYQ7_9BACT|nr:arylsulfatase [Pelagicoccus mobilis]MBK1879182.1 arylsulfatase [Pelagicoccus mobilis]
MRFIALITLSIFTLHPSLFSDDRPNLVLIMADDMGFSDIGSYGSEIPTPNIDKLANNGVRFTQFYNTSRCCPTRASLLTGLYQHQAGIGEMTKKQPTSTDGFVGHLNKNCRTIAEVLRPAGYRTYISGKWHVGKDEKDWWPLQRGFDRFYGLLDGASSFFRPKGLYEGNELLPVPNHPDYYTTIAFTDYAIQYIDETPEDTPFFLYLAYTAPHWPLHALDEDIALFRGKYKNGWDALREERFARQVELGIVSEKQGLSHRDFEVPAWDTLTEQEQDDLDHRMAVYAAMVYRMDLEIGRLVSHLEAKGELDNTLIVFLSDNGGCPEPWSTQEPRGDSHLGGGTIADIYDKNKRGGISYGQGWANASNTPFRRYKTQSHEGGISTPFIMSWPAGMKADPGSIINTPGHIIDVLPTFAELAGAEYPEYADGHYIHPLPGQTLTPALEHGALRPHDWLFFEHRLEGAVRHGDWKAIQRQTTGRWFLFNMAQDRTETNDLAEEYPEILDLMKRKWWEWAVTNKATPEKLPTRPQTQEPIDFRQR